MEKNNKDLKAKVCAVRNLGLEHSQYELYLETKSGNCYEFGIYASCMRYIVIVDSNGEYVLGIDSEPYINLESVYTNDNKFYKVA